MATRYIAPCDGSGLIVERIGDDVYDSACLGTTCHPHRPAPVRLYRIPADPRFVEVAS
jgi:hypothetical protein